MVKLKLSASALQNFHEYQQQQAQQQAQQLANPSPAPPPPSSSSAARPPPHTSTDTPSSKPKKPKAPKKPKPPTDGASALSIPRPTTSTSASASASTSTPAPKVPKKKKSTAKTPATNGAPAPPPQPPSLPQQPVTIKIKSAALTPQPASAQVPVPPKLKLTMGGAAQGAVGGTGQIRTPTIKLKHTPKPPTRKRRHEPGNGYDSEASDREEDPAIEENFILRMIPGEDCDYLRHVIERRELNTASDVWMKFKEQRKAVLNVRGNLYAALLVDLPCVIEANKTLDKKNIFKVADICQMLLVTQRIQHEEAIWDVKFNIADQQFPHGLTPPMQWARKRRFRKRISNRTIEMVEAEVERLLREDEKAVESSWALVDADEDGRGNLADQDEDAEFDLLGNAGYDDEQDAEGEVDHEYEYAPESGHVVEEVEMDEETLVGDLDAALFEAEAEAETSDEDEDEDVAAPEPELDDAAKEKLLQKEKLREEIQDLEDMIASKETEMEKIENNILRQRVAKTLSGFRDQREMKLAMLEQLGG